MNRRTFSGGVAVLDVLLRVDAQAIAKIPRIGLLRNARDAPDPATDGFRQGLQELGYVDGQSIQLESRVMESPGFPSSTR